jgi:predicted esterase
MKMEKLKIFLILFCLAISAWIDAQKYTTITYSDKDTLKLDLFFPQVSNGKKLPLVIYVHGGGFASGDRSSGHSICQYLAANGYIAASISYTLYMKATGFGCDVILSEKIKAMQYGVSDLWEATSFFIENREKYNIDTSKIFIAGSSAGAETALHATFWDFKTMNLFQTTLPKSFKYAGLVAGSGAIMDLNLINEKTKIPVMLFHGSGDELVPYGTAAHRYCGTNTPGWLMFFGSFSIYNHLVGLNGTVHLFTFCGGGHEYSAELFNKDQQYILDFFNDVMAGKKFQMHTIISTGKKNARSAVYEFCN